MPEAKTSRRNRRVATTKQLTALKLLESCKHGKEVGSHCGECKGIAKPISKRQAMLKAGYSPMSALNPKQNLMETQAIRSIIDKFHLQLKNEGITTEIVAKKYAEHLNAQKPIIDLKTGEVIAEVPDYKTQTEARKDLKDIFGLTPTKEDVKNVSRTITLTEYLSPTP